MSETVGAHVRRTIVVNEFTTYGLDDVGKARATTYVGA